MMRTVWRILRDPKDAEDAFQEALLKIWKRWHRIRTHPNLHALVLQIRIYAAHDALRRNVRGGKRLEAVAIPEDIPDSSASVIQNITGAEHNTQVLGAIGLLPKN